MTQRKAKKDSPNHYLGGQTPVSLMRLCYESAADKWGHVGCRAVRGGDYQPMCRSSSRRDCESRNSILSLLKERYGSVTWRTTSWEGPALAGHVWAALAVQFVNQSLFFCLIYMDLHTLPRPLGAFWSLISRKCGQCILFPKLIYFKPLSVGGVQIRGLWRRRRMMYTLAHTHLLSFLRTWGNLRPS